MADKTDAWMPLWIGSYLADTMRLTTIQHGAYLLLLMAYWRERCALPDDDDELRAITKTDKAEWKRMRPVIAKFFKVEDGVWWHKRVEAEIAGANERSQKATKKAEQAANARWKGHKPDAPSNAPSIPQAVHKDVLEECPTPSPSPSSLRSENNLAPTVLVPDPEKPGSDDPPSSDKIPPCPAVEIVALYHEVLPELPRVERLTPARQASMRQRWREWHGEKGWNSSTEGLADWRKFFVYIRKSDFLMGKTKPRPPRTIPFVADIDFLMAPGSHTKIFEGKYHGQA